MPRRRSTVLAVALLALFGLSAVACGGDTQGDIADGSSAEPAPPKPAPAAAEPAAPPAGPTDAAPQPAEASEVEKAEPDTEVSPDAGPDGASESLADGEGALEDPETPASERETTPQAPEADSAPATDSQASDAAEAGTEGSAEAGSDAGSGGPTDTEDTREGKGPDGDGFSVTIRSDGGTWTLDSPPARIVSLSPAATEILFAIGAGRQVVAVDNWSTYPPEAPTTDLSGFDPNIEAITAYEPDLVVIVNDTNNLVASLTALDIPVLVSANPLAIEGGYGVVAALGAATGHVTEAREVIETMRADMAAALANAPDVPIRVYHELDSTYYAVSSNSFIGSVYAALGTSNIADEADTEGYGYPQLTEEYIIEADPQLIVITDLTAYTADDVAARPGWESVSAVRDGNILVVNADIASRWGPRLPQFVGTLVEALAAIAAAGDRSNG